MALIDKASLLMVPSVYEDGTLYNILPSGNKAPDETGSHNGYDQTRADFTFSRGSNLSATRIGSDGLIEKGRENLLLQSNSFDTTWSSINTTEASGQSGYDGTNDAWLLTKSAASARVQQSISQSGVQTYSVYAKAGTLDFVMLNNGTVSQWYDLSNGTIGTNSSSANTIDANIEDIGNGWYRCSLTFNSSITVVRIYPSQADNDVSGTSGNIYIQDAQLEAGLVATDYIETGSTTAQAGILEDMPRINYDANGENGSLLLESSRTNLLTHSEYINTTDWNHQGVTSSVNTSETTSPEGVYNAVKFTATNTDPYIFRSVSVSAGDNTFSFYVKGTGSSVGKTARILFWYVGTATGTQTSHNFTLSDEWQRVDATTSPTGAGTLAFRIDIPADSAVVGDVCYLYGLQIEAGSYPSSIIPTHGAAVTRGADSCSVTGVSDVIGQTEGTLYWEGIAQPNDNPILVQLIPSAAGNYTNTIYLEYVHSTTNFKAKAYDTGTIQASISTGNVVAGQVYKLAFAYKANDFALYMNGTQIGTDTSGSVQSGLDKIGVGSLNGTTNAVFYGSEAKQVALFNERLSNTELAALTA